MSEMAVHEMICPICSGRGAVSIFRSKDRAYRVAMAKRLYKQKCSIRQIQAMMGYRSAASVWKLLTSKKK